MPTYAAPVAAPRVIKEVAEKDRRSRMAYSTYHQAPKKGGAGGAYTWGSAGDVMLDWSISTRIDHEIMIIWYVQDFEWADCSSTRGWQKAGLSKFPEEDANKF